MENPVISKNGGVMLGLKEDIDNAVAAIKASKKDVDDVFQQMIMKTSELADINKKIEEIQLASQMLLTSTKKNDMETAEKILRKMRKIIYDTRVMVVNGIQKSMLKAVQDMTEVESGFIMMSNLDNLAVKFNIIEEKIGIK
ncbi:MAG: hypothetical protein PWQ97_109 [Tepidanaerobacteraceae bacterium]|nr:hypothetical protein [Tepidanaerobacteraceae bacterium]